MSIKMDDLFYTIVLFILGLFASLFLESINKPEFNLWETLLVGLTSILLFGAALHWPRNRPRPKNAPVNAPAYTIIDTPEDSIAISPEQLPGDVLNDLSDTLLGQPAYTPLVNHQNNPPDDVVNDSVEESNGPSEGPYNSYYYSDGPDDSSEDSPIDSPSEGTSEGLHDSYYYSDGPDDSSEDSPIDRSRVEVMD